MRKLFTSGLSGARTHDILVVTQVLSQLSYQTVSNN